MSDTLRLLILGDLHYARGDDPFTRPADQAVRYQGCEMIARAVACARARGAIDAILLTGDMADMPGAMTFQSESSPVARQALQDVRDALDAAAPGVSVIAVPGNHDGPIADAEAVFGRWPGVVEIGHCRIAAFCDDQSPQRVRRGEDLALLERLASDARPLITLQHYPLHPDSGEMYTLLNRDEVMAAYDRAGVLLAVSGHAHVGLPPRRQGGVLCLTATGMYQPPHAFAVATIRGREVTIETIPMQLSSGDPPVVDMHAHTEFAYCGKNISADEVIVRSRQFGLSGVTFAEHAPQLYMLRDDFWQGRHIYEPALWRSPLQNRMGDYRRMMDQRRSDYVRAGFEVELDSSGDLTIFDEDRDWAQVLVGAVHWLTVPEQGRTAAEIVSTFMNDCRRLCEAGIDVLAHPWRYFRRSKSPTPRDRYGELADILAATGTAAEINYHTNDPDPAFFAECIARDVKIALASDGHLLAESGAFRSHLDCLRAAAGSTADLVPLIFSQSRGD
ncbi:MAG: metallophosphoesterase [Planctomycetaceae bacterium]|nr:metallophosphoesterase [Planctomycetaceae bacterium]